MESTFFAAYALKHNEKVRKKSSSGGAFTAILEAVQEMCDSQEFPDVAGVAFDPQFNVVYKIVHNLDETCAFRGSKYVKASIQNILQCMEKLIASGRTVVFCGVPCQVDAIKHSVERKGLPKSNLYLVDIICHGTIKENIWRDYIRWLEDKYGSEISTFSFRCKDVGWHDYPVSVTFKNGKFSINRQDVQMIMTLYMTRMCMNESCYKCHYASMDRISDITLGDFWGIEKIYPEFADKLGVSLVIANTEQGMKICRKLEGRKDFQLWKCCSDEYVNYQLALNGPAHKPKEYDIFWEDYERGGFQLILKKYAGNNLVGKLKYSLKKKVKNAWLYRVLKCTKSKLISR